MRLTHLAVVLAMGSLRLVADGLTPQQVQQARTLSASWYQEGWSNNGRVKTYFPQMTPSDQADFLIGTAQNNSYRPNRDAALVLLASRPGAALDRALAQHPEARLALYRLGYRAVGADATAFLGWNGHPERPWMEGIALHLDSPGWHLQVIPAAAFLPGAPQGAGLPDALAPAPLPSVLIHLTALKPGLARLAELAGGPDGSLIVTAAGGPRAGFLATHLQRWMKDASPALVPLENREAWILHYGHRDLRGTLAFLPGDLPARSAVMLSLLKLNPLSSGARSRTMKLKDGTTVEAVRGSGGGLFIERKPEGIWITDRAELLEATHKPSAHPMLGERREWGRLALAGMDGAQASLWLLPQIGAGADYECALLRLKEQPRALPPASSAGLTKGAPRDAAISLALGPGPTDVAIAALLARDDAYEVPEPDSAETLVGRGEQLTPEQRAQRDAWIIAAKRRKTAQAALRREVEKLKALLDTKGAAIHWNGWTAAPALDDATKAQLATFRKEGRWTDAQGVNHTDAPGFGGFGEPGLTPGLSLVLPLQAGKGAEAEGIAARLLKLSFKGVLESRSAGTVTLHRMRTAQAFSPTYARVGDALVLASDDAEAAEAVAGLQGQAPTLADLSGGSWGLAHLDGARLAPALGLLLRSYLASQNGQRHRWWEETPDRITADDVSEEVASTFGPFLDLIRKQGLVDLDLSLTAGGVEAKPR